MPHPLINLGCLVFRLAASHLFSGLGSLLADETSYYVSLRVVNAASLSAVSSAPFTVSLQPPDMSNATLPHFDNDTVVETISGRDVAFMDRTDSLSVALPTLNNEDSSVQFIGMLFPFLQHCDLNSVCEGTEKPKSITSTFPHPQHQMPSPTCAQAHRHTRMHIRTYVCMHTRMHACMHAHTHARTHA